MRCSCSIVLIIFGLFILSLALLLKFGLGFITRVGFPMGMGMMPLNQDFMAWIDIPLPMALVARIKGVTALPPSGGSIGGGLIQLEMDLSKWEEEEGGEPLKLTEAVLIQEVTPHKHGRPQ